MCGRAQQHFDSTLLPDFFPELKLTPFKLTSELCPTDKAMLIRAQVQEGKLRYNASPARWGLIPSWASDPKKFNRTFNARAEELMQKVSYKKPFQKQRGLVPLSAFYEWKKEGRKKTRFDIKRADGSLLFLAALWDVHPEIGLSFSIITTTPNEVMAEIYDRMPVILAPEDWQVWCDPSFGHTEVLSSLLIPCPDSWLKTEAEGNDEDAQFHLFN